MIDGKYEYFAFISYCWEDDKIAEDLQKTLEGYKFPTSLREKNPNLPTKIRPVFRDKTDLNGHRLEESLISALESSRYLIVICSPQATKSDWVNRGIQRFIDLGREKDIIPFIVDGEANADDPKNECFPLALRSLKGERAIYGININDNGRDAAAVKVVSRMFDVKYDALWNRFLLEQKKKRRYTIAGLLAAILIVAGVAGYIWTQNQELDKRNVQIETQYKELQAKNAQIEQQNKDLDAKSDSITKVNTALTVAKDSIQRAYEKLDLSEKNLAKSNADLKVSNIRLAEERDNVLKANWRMMENQSRAVAEKCKELINNGEVLKAIALLNEVLPDSLDSNIKPVTDEALSSLRLAYNKLVYENESYTQSNGHLGEFLSLAFSGDDKRLYSSSNDKTARVWSTKTGQEIESLRMNHPKSVLQVLCNPVSNDVLTRDYDNNVYLWKENAQGRMDSILLTMSYGDISLSYPGSYLIVPHDGIYETKEYVKIIDLGNDIIAIDDDENMLAVLYNDSVKVKKLNENERVLNLKVNVDTCYCSGMKFSHDSKYLAVHTIGNEEHNHRLSIYDIASGKSVFVLDHYHISDYKFDPGNRVFALSTGYSNDKSIRYYEMDGFSEIEEWRKNGDSEDIRSIAYSYSGNFFAASYGSHAKLYFNPERKKEYNKIDMLFGTNGATALNVDFPNQTLFASDYENIHVQKFNKEKRVYSIRNATQIDSTYFVVDNIIYNKKHNIVALAWRGKDYDLKHKVNIWNISEDTIVYRNELDFSTTCDQPTISFSFDKNGEKLLSTGFKDEFGLWNPESGQLIRKFYGHSNTVEYVAFINDSIVVSSACDNTIRFWNVNDGQEIKDKRINTDKYMTVVNISDDGNFLVCADYNNVYVYNIKSGIILEKTPLVGLKEYVQFVGNGNIIVTHKDENYNFVVSGIEFVNDENTYNAMKIYNTYNLSQKERKRYFLE